MLGEREALRTQTVCGAKWDWLSVLTALCVCPADGARQHLTVPRAVLWARSNHIVGRIWPMDLVFDMSGIG